MLTYSKRRLSFITHGIKQAIGVLSRSNIVWASMSPIEKNNPVHWPLRVPVSDDLFCKTFFIPSDEVQFKKIIGGKIFFNSGQNTKSLAYDHLLISDVKGIK